MNAGSGLIAVALAFACAFAAVAGVPISYEALQARWPGNVRYVTTCGYWKHEGESGWFRITEALVYGQSFLYAEWLTDEQDAPGTVRTVRAEHFPEMFDDHSEAELSNIRCRRQRDGVVVTADVEQYGRPRRAKLTLRLYSEPGRYRLVYPPYGGEVARRVD